MDGVATPADFCYENPAPRIECRPSSALLACLNAKCSAGQCVDHAGCVACLKTACPAVVQACVDDR